MVYYLTVLDYFGMNIVGYILRFCPSGPACQGVRCGIYGTFPGISGWWEAGGESNGTFYHPIP
jgi:hypothetical protein